MFLIFLIIGLVAGVLSGMFGIGGGIVIVPTLIFALGYTQISASATSLIALLLPVGALGVWKYYKAGYLQPENFRAGGLIAIGLFIGAFFGAKLAIGLPEEVLRKCFAVFLLAVAVKLWIGK